MKRDTINGQLTGSRLTDFRLSIGHSAPVIIYTMLLMASSCTSLESETGAKRSKDIIPRAISTIETRSPYEDSGTVIGVYAISEDAEQPLYLQVVEKDNAILSSDVCRTKGEEVTTSTLESFYMKAYAEEEWSDPSGSQTGQNPAGQYFDRVSVTKSGSSWNMETSKLWLADIPVTFWSWNILEPVVNTAMGTARASFSNYSTPLSPADQKDLVFAYNRELRKFGNNGEVTEASSSNASYNRKDNELDIHFYHALAQIKVDASGINGAVLKSVTLKNILKSSKACSISVNDGVPEFSWDYSRPIYGDFAQAYASDDSGESMFMIPHVLNDNASIEITLAKSSDPADVIKESVPIAKMQTTDINNIEWKAGKYYTYRLTSDPFAYTWEYRFALPSPDNTADLTKQTESYAITNEDLVKYIDISSLKVRQDKPDVGGSYGYHIKSYQIAGGPVQPVDSTFSEEEAGFTDVRIDGQNRLVLPISKKTLLDRGTNRYWYDLKDGSDWHPADWIDQTAGNPIDLSRMDYRTDDISLARNAFPMTTANCYIIRHAGWYKLPLIYGNAMSNGSPNVDAYAPFPSDHDDSDLVLGVFKNHLDQEITSPFIENNAGCDALTCEVLWQANGEAVQQLCIDGTQRSTDDYDASNVRYLKFYMDPSKISQNNSLIAIKDENGRIIWSWQIWSTNDPLLLEAPIEVTSYTGSKYWFFQIPSIGRIIQDEYPSRPDVTITLAQDAPSTMPDLKVVIKQPALKMDGEYVTYQFGRKDPIRTGEKVYASEVPIATGPVSLGTLIQNPGTFYTFPSSDRYATAYGPKYKNLWSGKDTRVTGSPIERAPDMIKTIYDPSPIGYKVPASGAYSGFTTTGVNSFWVRSAINATSDIPMDIDGTSMKNLISAMGGINLYTSLGPGHALNTGGPAIWFPKDGMRAGFTGRFTLTNGMYYTCNFCNMNESYAMLLGNSLGVGTASPCNGHNVRCVTDPGFTPWWTSTGAPK